VNDQYMIDLGLVSSSGQASELLSRFVPDLESVGTVPSMFVSNTWTAINNPNQLSNGLRGTVLELLVGLSLVRAGITPFFRQAEITYVNNAKFDFLLWEQGWNPISLSVKTSLRERYKQAELEAGALQNVHRRSENYLITLEAKEVATRRRKLEKATEFSNLHRLILADTTEFDELISQLAQKVFAKPKDINPMGNNLIVAG
jgi:hypothetical protein